VSAIVVDTSTWIDFLAGGSVPALEDALAHGAIVVPPIVVAELLSGARRQQDRRIVTDLLQDVPLHETPRSHWVSVGALRRHLASKGLAVSVPDAHVAQCTLDLHGLLLTHDTVFSRIARLTPLRLVAP
jgi:predicted nucleic acid-binding protein